MNFMAFAANFGYAVKGGKGNKVHPRALQKLLEDIEGTKEQTVISTMMLRSMKQAKYDAESTGHFGLAAEFYTHFTSPIRRYPDLVIHRIIREVIEHNGVLPADRQEYLNSRMQEIAQQSSERERVAVEAERDTEQLKKAEYMLDKVGEVFPGMISSVTSFGMFIELENTVEGLIHISTMTDDYYHFHEQHMALIGERTSRIFRIGDEVEIRVARVNMDEHTIDFELVDMKPRKREGSFGGEGGGRDARSGDGFRAGKRRGGRASVGEGSRAGARAGAGGKSSGKPGKAGKAGDKTRGKSGGKSGKAGKTDKSVSGKNGKLGKGPATISADQASAGENWIDSIPIDNGTYKAKRGKRKGSAGDGAGDSSAVSFGFGSGKGGYAAGSVAVSRDGGGGYRSGEKRSRRHERASEENIVGGGVAADEATTTSPRKGRGSKSSGSGSGRKAKSGGNSTAAFVRKKRK